MDKLASLGNEFSKIILDKFDGIAYIVDIDTYDFVYINKHFRELLNITDDSYLEKKMLSSAPRLIRTLWFLY